jgi:hypothetical protein
MSVSLALSLLITVLAIRLYFLHRAVLPKPSPGIPHNKDAQKAMLGDVPEMISYVFRTKRIFVSPNAIVRFLAF